MSSNHLVSTLISSVNNACAVKKPQIFVPYSKFLVSLLEVLRSEGFIISHEIVPSPNGENFNAIKVVLKYFRGERVIRDFSVVSKPGRRRYSQIKKLRTVYDGFGFHILSTSRGVMTDRSARALNVGGEVICSIF